MKPSAGLPVRLAAAVVISDLERQILLVRRSRMVDEYPGVWSFPSTFVDAGATSGQIASNIAAKADSWLGLNLPSLELLRVHDGIRPAWRLRMYLYGAISRQIPQLRTTKYDALQWVDGPMFFGRFNRSTLGDCSKAYLEYLDERGEG